MRPYTVVDSDNYKAAGIDAFFFPGGEPHVKLPHELPERMLLFLKLRTWNDVGLAAMLLDACKRANGYARAFIPYFPGGRQDRTDKRTPLTPYCIWKLLEQSNIPMIGFDPHSQYSGSFCWDNFMPAHLEVSKVMPRYDGIIVPDEGAMARAKQLGDHLNVNLYTHCTKERDFSTGHITGYRMPKLWKPGRYLIVDDICDGGATFNMLAHEFFKDESSDASELDLWVSHGIFSKGVSNIDKRISRIYTTDSWYNGPQFNGDDTKRLTVFPLAPLFDKIMES